MPAPGSAVGSWITDTQRVGMGGQFPEYLSRNAISVAAYGVAGTAGGAAPVPAVRVPGEPVDVHPRSPSPSPSLWLIMAAPDRLL